MDPKHLTILEFPKVLERLARHTHFAPGRERALALTPCGDLYEARRRQMETSEARWLLSVRPTLSVGGARDIRPIIQQALLSAILLPVELLDVRQTLLSAYTLKRSVLPYAERIPLLAELAVRLHECPELVQEIGRCIHPNGSVLDEASPTLLHIRRELGLVRQRLITRLEQILHDPENSAYLQEPLITQRQGRYVIPLRAEFKGRIRGIIHDQSTSGATLFVEPMATVELNNQLRQLEVEEEQEVQRILARLSQQVAAAAESLHETLQALAELDLALAKAHYAEELNAVPAQWADGDKRPSFRLLNARHPLIDPHTVVPIDVVLEPQTFILVITGPNTGGKTVTLKTIGLLVCMAQAGLHIPASESSQLPFYDAVYADIGDEQSIEQSLSTFSGHLTNIVHFLEHCTPRSLVILDELGAGTDPLEGSALARAILEYLRERDVTTFVATHYPELKWYAHQTPGVTNASVEFDSETLAPTYRLSIGLPGRSNAFAIARRLGLDARIIEAAQAMVAPDVRQVETMLHDIQATLDAARRERAAAEALRLRLEAQSEELRQRLARVEAERRDILNTARAEARREIEAVRRELQALRAQLPKRPPWQLDAEVSEEEKALQQAAEALDAMEMRLVETSVSSPPSTAHRGPLHPGDIVWVQPLQTLGEVIESHRGRVEVQVGRFRTTVRRNQVELRAHAADRQTTAAEMSSGLSHSAPPRPLSELTATPPIELDLRGCTSEEALVRLERYLDEAYRANMPWVRIIHGKGTGVLRQAVREALQAHPLVASFRPGEEGEGGDGATVIYLAVE
ncbi:MAG: endonuclease MutS2 [Anaerolineae bacterium]